MVVDIDDVFADLFIPPEVVVSSRDGFLLLLKNRDRVIVVFKLFVALGDDF